MHLRGSRWSAGLRWVGVGYRVLLRPRQALEGRAWRLGPFVLARWRVIEGEALSGGSAEIRYV